MEENDSLTPRTPAEAYPLLKGAVGPILEHNEEARGAYDAMRERGLTEEAAREEIARVLLAVMFHIGAGSDRLTAASRESTSTSTREMKNEATEWMSDSSRPAAAACSKPAR